VLLAKFADALATHLPARRVRDLLALTSDISRFEATPVHLLLDLFAL
jgi:2-methylcitrate dehydratase